MGGGGGGETQRGKEIEKRGGWVGGGREHRRERQTDRQTDRPTLRLIKLHFSATKILARRLTYHLLLLQY